MASTLKDVAALAGVSLTTASHALNGKRVNADTRERVLAASKQLKYHTSAIGRNLITNKSNTIGMYVLNSKKSRDMTEEITYYYGMMLGALACIQQHDYVFNFEVVDWEDLDDKQFIAKKVYSRSIDGMILVPQFLYPDSFLHVLEEEHFPYVVVDPYEGIRPENSISVDNVRGGYLAAAYLLSLGHRDIVLINGPENHIDARTRERGFLAGFLESGMQCDRNHILYSDFTHEGGYAAAREILEDRRLHPTAIFCSNDYMASGVVAALQEAGQRVPDDMSVVGYDDTDIARCIHPKLTTVRTAVKDLGFLAAERVLHLIGDKDNRTIRAYPEILLQPTLIERDSTRTV